jgi:hypothetical protein
VVIQGAQVVHLRIARAVGAHGVGHWLVQEPDLPILNDDVPIDDHLMDHRQALARRGVELLPQEGAQVRPALHVLQDGCQRSEQIICRTCVHHHIWHRRWRGLGHPHVTALHSHLSLLLAGVLC